MTYASMIEYLYGLQKHGIKLGLDTMRAILERLGNPQRRFRVLHIGGTNGKGSTSAMAAAMLQQSSLRVGLYTSPHLVDFRERIRVNSRLISEEHAVQLVDRIRGILHDDLTPTFFEMITALAFLHFAESAVEIAVLEVGLGGRFDATNVVEQPLACGITTIGLDHQEYLGPSEEAIAFEKGGIIKPSVPVIIGRIGPEAERVLSRIAAEQSAPVRRLGRDFSIEESRVGQFTYRGMSHLYEGLTCGLAGQHQWDNAACAIALLEAAGGAGLVFSERAVQQGLQTVSWEGRIECVQADPLVMLDGAHNPHAAQALVRYLSDYVARHSDARLILVWGMMRDKDHRGFITPFLPIVSDIVLTQATLARSATVHELRRAVPVGTHAVHEAMGPAEALSVAKRRATSKDLICVTGSLMLVGDIKAVIRGCGLSPIRG